jgi:hypothetical protein
MPPPWQAPQQPSGLRNAAGVLLLVGAILAAVGAVMLLLVTILFSVVLAELGSMAGTPGPIGFIAWFYGAFGLLAAAGSACGFVAWHKANQDDLHGAFVWGLVGSLLPPVNILSLLGAIFAKTCPEGEAQSRRPHPSAPQVR